MTTKQTTKRKPRAKKVLSGTQRRLGVNYICGIDPKQDAIIAWIDSLPIAPDTGAIKRSVVKYHLTEALTDYLKKISKKEGAR